MATVLHRSLMPFVFIGMFMLGLYQFVPELRTPLASTLLALTVVLVTLRPIEREIRSSSRFRTRVLVIGDRPIAHRMMEEIERAPQRGYTIVGVVQENPAVPVQHTPYLVLGCIDDLRRIVTAVKPDLIVLALSDRRGRMPAAELLDFQSNGIVIEDAADAYERVSGKLPIEVVTPGQLIASQSLRKSTALKAMQRFFSCAAAVVLLLLCAPLLALIAVAIKIDSGGPILFRQVRLGKRFRPFQLIKFRTMAPVERAASEWAQDNAERITAVGRVLRKLRLDELPQLVNVLRGDMNLVGPRPHPITNLQLFRDAIPYYVLRGSILPGITGWAQVRYHYANNLEEETEKMRYDLYYIKHMSLWMDLAIIVQTCGVFLSSLTSKKHSDVRVPDQIVVRGPRLHIRAQAASPRPAPALLKPHELDQPGRTSIFTRG